MFLTLQCFKCWYLTFKKCTSLKNVSRHRVTWLSRTPREIWWHFERYPLSVTHIYWTDSDDSPLPLVLGLVAICFVWLTTVRWSCQHFSNSFADSQPETEKDTKTWFLEHLFSDLFFWSTFKLFFLFLFVLDQLWNNLDARRHNHTNERARERYLEHVWTRLRATIDWWRISVWQCSSVRSGRPYSIKTGSTCKTRLYKFVT